MAETQRGVYFIEPISENAWKIHERRDATMYLVRGSERACLIDTAYGLCDLRELAAELTDLPVTVVNTHGHVDHVLGNHWFYDGGAGRAYMHPADRPMYDALASGFADMLDEPWVRETYGDFIEGVDPAAVRFPAAADIREGDVIDLGGKALEVVEMPGHTPGSVLLLDRADRICYSGDAIIEHVWLFLEESLPPETYLDSLRRAREALGKTGIERIYDGHFNHHPLTLHDVDDRIAGMAQIVAGIAEGQPFENFAGSGVEYTFGDWSALCPSRPQAEPKA